MTAQGSMASLSAEEVRRIDAEQAATNAAAIRKSAKENPTKLRPISSAAEPQRREDELTMLKRHRWIIEAAIQQREGASKPAIQVRSILDGITDSTRIEWLLKPYLEKRVLALLFGDLGTLKSFLALHWAMTLAAQGMPTLYLSAEGRGLMRRARGWILHTCPSDAPEKVASRLPFYAVERALDLSRPDIIEQLIAAVEDAAVPPQLIVIDTLGRYGGALDENSARDIAGLITALDALRLRYNASVLIVHHTGHGAKDRARGSYALMAATDAHFLVERPDPMARVITVTTGRLKDSESPAPFTMEADVVNLGTIDDGGKPETTLVLRATDRLAPVSAKRPTGKNQKDLLADLERRHATGETVWTEGRLREIGREIGMHKNSSRDAVLGLRTLGYLTATIAGSRLTHQSLQGPKDRNRDEIAFRPTDVGTEKTESPLGLGLSSRPSPNPEDLCSHE